MLISNKFGLIYCLVLAFASAGKVGFLFDEPPVGEPGPPVALWVITSPINGESWVDTHGTVEVEGTKIKHQHGLIQFRTGGGGGSWSLYDEASIANSNNDDWSNGFDKKPVDTKWPTPGTQPGNTHPWKLELYGDSQVADPNILEDDKFVSFLAT